MVWDLFLTDLMKWLLPIFVTSLTGYVFILMTRAIIDLKAKFPSQSEKIIIALKEVIPQVVDFLEQERKVGHIDLMSIQAAGEAKIQELLKLRGINIDVGYWSDYIEVLVKAAVRKLPPFTFSADK